MAGAKGQAVELKQLAVNSVEADDFPIKGKFVVSSPYCEHSLHFFLAQEKALESVLIITLRGAGWARAVLATGPHSLGRTGMR
jgi:hypothetical protein